MSHPIITPVVRVMTCPPMNILSMPCPTHAQSKIWVVQVIIVCHSGTQTDQAILYDSDLLTQYLCSFNEVCGLCPGQEDCARQCQEEGGRGGQASAARRDLFPALTTLTPSLTLTSETTRTRTGRRATGGCRSPCQRPGAHCRLHTRQAEPCRHL